MNRTQKEANARTVFSVPAGRFPLMIGSVVLAALSFFAASVQAGQADQAGQDEQAARYAAGRATSILLELVRKQRPVSRDGVDAFANAVLESPIDDFVAFDLVARSVMGHHGKKARPEQMERFIRDFRVSLVKFYSRSLVALELDPLKLDFCMAPVVQNRPQGGQAQRRSTMAVDMVFGYPVNDRYSGKRPVDCRDESFRFDKEKHRYSVTYKMVDVSRGGSKPGSAGQWKVRGIVLEGINIGLQFKNQFTAALRQSGGNLDRVINNWDNLVNPRDGADAGRQNS